MIVRSLTYLFIALSFLCSCGYNDGPYPEKEYVDIGHFALSDSILNLPAYNLDTSIRFKHSSDNIIEYHIGFKSRTSETHYLDDSLYTYDRLVYNISSHDFAPSLRLTLKAIRNNGVQVDIAAGTLRNIFILNDSFSSVFTSRDLSYHDTLTIQGNLFQDVYHITTEVSYSPSQRISSMVYSLKEGLVGFYINKNADAWVRVK